MITHKTIERFHSLYERRAPSDCWLWRGRRNPDGYGGIDVNGINSMAHRLAYTLAYGPIPKGLNVLHMPVICHNRACVNPAHLMLGNQSMNEAHKRLDGTVCEGERHPRATLSNDDVLLIRWLHETGAVTNTAIAAHVGTSVNNVGLIVRRKAWAHL